MEHPLYNNETTPDEIRHPAGSYQFDTFCVKTGHPTLCRFSDTWDPIRKTLPLGMQRARPARPFIVNVFQSLACYV
jgi:hypothetical protein